VSVGSHPRWLTTHYIFGSLEEPLGRGHIAVLTQHRVDHVAISINGAIEVVPLAANFDVRLIGISRTACFAFAPGAQLLCDKRSKACFPVSNCFMCEFEAAHQEHLG